MGGAPKRSALGSGLHGRNRVVYKKILTFYLLALNWLTISELTQYLKLMAGGQAAQPAKTG